MKYGIGIAISSLMLSLGTMGLIYNHNNEKIIFLILIIGFSLLLLFISLYHEHNAKLLENILAQLKENSSNNKPKESSIDTIAKQILKGEIPPKE